MTKYILNMRFINVFTQRLLQRQQGKQKIIKTITYNTSNVTKTI